MKTLMNKKLMTILVVLLSCLVFVAVGTLTANDVPDEVTIENDGYKKDKKGPVKLSHATHVSDYGVKCDDCHHVYEDGKNCWKEGDPVQKCGECHDPLKKDGKVKKLQNAYHKNCKNCHKDYVKAHPDSKAPFKKCNDCHEKKS